MIITAFPAADTKKTLALDTFAKILSVALSDGKKIYYAQADTEMKHSELVMEFIENLMKEAALTPAALQGVLCMAGPGSFTGLRIGYSIAKGLALSLSIPFAAIPTLDCIAYQITVNNDLKPANTGSRLPTPDSSIILSLIEARKNSYFYAFYQNEKRLTPDKEADIEQITGELMKICVSSPMCELSHYPILTGPASCKFYEILPQDLKEKIIIKNENKGYANELIYLAKKRNILDNDGSTFLCKGPEYIRKTDAEIALFEKVDL
ncbi:MAG: tRNA (adenosine(37)-N6)-threonylcarbamoyltransferase complex dimerization subunit type 1 TsaB [Treponema sp.]|nr:tRNA (adenosine(37)-N6)-threonylcarbamoyltransferase complex dimerization subunit type 1 TsaB [Treponema sp.]